MGQVPQLHCRPDHGSTSLLDRWMHYETHNRQRFFEPLTSALRLPIAIAQEWHRQHESDAAEQHPKH